MTGSKDISQGETIAGQDNRPGFRHCHKRYAPAFARHKELIGNIVENRSPAAVACLGAGVLNDIPYLAILHSGAKLHLLDWQPGAIETGISISVISEDTEGKPQCAYCALGRETAWMCCRNYTFTDAPPQGVCGNFVASKQPPVACEAVEPGDWPLIHVQDATAGYAHAFLERIGDALKGATSWRQAFSRANALARRLEQTADWRQKLDIEDSSIDLVTSSMLLTQFEHEPYNYFSKLAATRLGAPRKSDEKLLAKAMERLRNRLVERQIEEHCAEIKRILTPDGLVFISFELFQFNNELEEWYLVKEMHRTLGVLDSLFRFQFEIIPENKSIFRFEGGDAPSIVAAFVLRDKARPGATH